MMRPLSGKRITRQNLEPVKGDVAKILQPFVFDEPVIPPPLITYLKIEATQQFLRLSDGKYLAIISD